MSEDHGNWNAAMLRQINLTVESLIAQNFMEDKDDHPYTPRVKNSLARARKIAAGFGHAYTGCEHVFLALLEQPNVTSLLVAAGAEVETLISKTNAAFKEANAPKPEVIKTDDMIAMLRRAADILEKQREGM